MPEHRVGEGDPIRARTNALVSTASACAGASADPRPGEGDAGGRVVAAARGERKLALARELGAEVVVDYSEEGWQHRVRDAVGGAGVDLVFDGAGGALGRTAFETVAEGGRFVTYGTSDGFADIDPQVAEQRQVRVTNAVAGPTDPAAVRELLAEALTLTAQGRIRPVIGAAYPLAQAKEAHASLARRATVGKSLLLIGEAGSSR